jgi:hypothetical protein
MRRNGNRCFGEGLLCAAYPTAESKAQTAGSRNLKLELPVYNHLDRLEPLNPQRETGSPWVASISFDLHPGGCTQKALPTADTPDGESNPLNEGIAH